MPDLLGSTFEMRCVFFAWTLFLQALPPPLRGKVPAVCVQRRHELFHSYSGIPITLPAKPEH
jgi:hypothetical protein